MQHAIPAGRSNYEGSRHLTSEQRDSMMAIRRVDQCLRHEAQRLQRLAVAPEGGLVLGASLHVLEDEPWNAPPGNLAKIRDVDCLLDVTAAGQPAAPGHANLMSGKLHDVDSIGSEFFGSGV